MTSDEDLDRNLPQTIAGIVFGLVLGGLFGSPLGWLLGLRGISLLLFILVAGIAMGTFIKRFTTTVTEGTANAFLHLVWPSGSSTPYSQSYSYEQSLVAKGDVDGAVSRFRLAAGLHPKDPEPRLRAAELLFRSGTPGEAVRLFNEARQLSPEHEMYVTQRLIDLYIGPLKSDVKALTELRRLIDRFPGTPEAESAQKLYDRIRLENSA